jgi:hypothetical protein
VRTYLKYEVRGARLRIAQSESQIGVRQPGRQVRGGLVVPAHRLPVRQAQVQQRVAPELGGRPGLHGGGELSGGHVSGRRARLQDLVCESRTQAV